MYHDMELRRAFCDKPSKSKVIALTVAGLISGILFLRLVIATDSSHQLLDIDIGTNGVPMLSKAHKVLTFDPGDSQLTSVALEKYPFVIADFNGEATFYINEDEQGCSSLNLRNEYYNQTRRDNQIKRRCPGTSFAESRLFNCMHSKRLRQTKVQVRRISSFLKARGITHINKLKLDAQGSDFAIVKDFFENADNTDVNILQVECQDYGQAIPLYFTSNDCSNIVQYVRRKRPNLTHRKVMNNCMAAEYNLIMQLK